MNQEAAPGSSPEATDGVTEDSPSSQDVSPETLEGAIRGVLDESGELADDDQPIEDQPEGEAEQADSSPDDGEESDSGQEEAAEAGADDIETLLEQLRDKDVPLGKIERFKEVLEQNKQYKSQVEQLSEVQERLAELEVSARRSGIPQEQVQNYFSLFSLVEKDPAQALQLINEFRDDLASRLGEHLPPDLQEKVEQGYLDEESARRIARAEAQARLGEHRLKETEEEARVRRLEEHRQSVAQAVNTMQQQLASSDPDYSRKHRFVKRELTALVAAEGMPPSIEKARDMVQRAYSTVNKDLEEFVPKPAPTRTLRGRGENRPATPKPETMQEAIMGALQGSMTED